MQTTAISSKNWKREVANVVFKIQYKLANKLTRVLADPKPRLVKYELKTMINKNFVWIKKQLEMRPIQNEKIDK
jgi:hypothetical protein